jgi:hypothetical protein
MLLLAAAMLLAGTSLPARADDDLPGRVGRIADFAGQLFLSPEDRAAEWQSIGLNYPVSSGDNLWVGGDGRAEVDYGGGQFRMAGDTNLHVSRLDENRIALFVAQGRVIVRVRLLDAGDSARVDTPGTQIELTRPGLYRIDVVPDRQSTVVTVRDGEAFVALANGTQPALPGQTLTIIGQNPAFADVRNAMGQDGFDGWSVARDRHYDRPRATAYVSPQMVGYADLDEYGTWQSTPEYGPVWYPTAVAADWAPYRDGYWTNVGGWGSTWVDAAPWGYAPFHYGRWAWVGGRWGWCPGRFVARPIWAPALVGWVGGASWGVSVRFGSPVYGWVPLGWGEPFHPWWNRCSQNCWANFNRPYAVNVTVRPNRPPTTFRNVAYPGAVTAVAGATLAGRLPVASNRVNVPAQQLGAAPVLAVAPAVATGPSRIPGIRPGASGTPQPASTFYPVSRMGRPGSETVARPQPGASGVGTASSGQATGRPTGAPMGTMTPAPAPQQPANVPAATSAPARTETQARSRLQPAPAQPAQMQSASRPPAGAALTPSPSMPQAQSVPANAMPPSRTQNTRAPTIERVAPMPAQPQQQMQSQPSRAPHSAPAQNAGAPMMSPAPAPRAAQQQVAPAQAPVQGSAHAEKQQAKPAAQKVEQNVPAKP